MMLRRKRKHFEVKPSMRRRLFLGLGAIAMILLLTSVISIMEYRRMSNYVSDLIASNIKSINLSQKLASLTDEYNLQVLAVIGDDALTTLPDFDRQYFLDQCDSLRKSFTTENALPLADSVVHAYEEYMMTSFELDEVLLSDFIDSRTWYFERLQPYFHRLHGYIERLNEMIYEELKMNSEHFDDGFYRSIVPGMVAVGAGLLLVVLLLYFIMVYYVKPIYRISDGIDNYRTIGKKYGYTFDGDDQLANINIGVTELIEENLELKKRVQSLRDGHKDSNRL